MEFLNKVVSEWDIVGVIAWGAGLAGVMMILVVVVGSTAIIISNFYRHFIDKRAMKRRPINTFKTSEDEKDMQDGIKSIALVLICIIAVCWLTHGR